MFNSKKSLENVHTVQDRRLNFDDAYPPKYGIHFGATQQLNVDGWMDGMERRNGESQFTQLLNFHDSYCTDQSSVLIHKIFFTP